MLHAPATDRRRAAPWCARLLAAAALGLGLAGCAQLSGNAGHVTIQHLAFQPFFADMEAQRHCETFGKKAVKVRVGPIQPGPLAVQTRITEYDCVAKN